MKIFTREVKIALTAIIALVLLYLLINFMKGINVFKSTNSYNVEFANIQGLAVSSAVYANGFPVGIVRDIQYDYSKRDRVVVNVELDKEMRVPEGTHAELVSSLMGGITMHLILGPNPTKILPRESVIPGDIHLGALAKAEEIIPTLINMAPKIDSIVSNLNTRSAHGIGKLCSRLCQPPRDVGTSQRHADQPSARNDGKPAESQCRPEQTLRKLG